MLNQHHPDDERLSALASHDDDAIADVALTSHVHTCARCAETVAELGVLRVSLADLPDLRPSRPLQLLPPVADDPAAARAGGWVRRLFAPALTAGAAIAMVGLIGTATPALDGMASSAGSVFENVGDELSGGDSAVEEVGGQAAESMRVAAPAGEYDSGDGDAEAAPSDATLGASGGEGRLNAEDPEDGVSRVDSDDDQLPAQRSPWPMVLFTGVALMVAAGLLRWILVPRAG
jgi:hypothetical protein